MKKLLSIALFAWAGLALTACEQDHIDAQYIPGNVVAPVAGAVTGAGALALDGPAVTVAYTKADLGMPAAVKYTLYADLSETMENRQAVANARFGDAEVTMTAKDLNTALINAGGEPAAEVTVYLQIAVSMLTDKEAVVEGTESLSNIVSALFTPYNAEVLDVDLYDHVWIIGDYCSWNHGASQFLYDYEKKGVYTGVVDFGAKAANGFKITGIAGWEDSCNWGADHEFDADADEAEAKTVQLIAGGGSKNIQHYSKRFYSFSFNKSTLVLTQQWGADQIGIIGDFNGWGGDVVMEYNPLKVRFYADIEVASDGGLKFRADAGWDLNWGADCVRGGNNIPVKAGNYRVYLNLNKNEIEFSEKMYGQSEPTE